MSTRRHPPEHLHQELELLRNDLATRLSGFGEGTARCTVAGFDPSASTALFLVVRSGADEALTQALPGLVDQVAGVVRSELRPLLITTTHPAKEPLMSTPPAEDVATTTGTVAQTAAKSATSVDEQDPAAAEADVESDSEEDAAAEVEAEEVEAEEEADDEDKDDEDGEEEDEDDEDGEDEPNNEDEEEDEEDEDEEDDDEEDEEDEEDGEEEEEDEEDVAAEEIRALRAELAELKKLLAGGSQRCLTKAEAEAMLKTLREDLADEDHGDEFWTRMQSLLDDRPLPTGDDDPSEVVPRRAYEALAKGVHRVVAEAVEPVRFRLGEFTLRR